MNGFKPDAPRERSRPEAAVVRRVCMWRSVFFCSRVNCGGGHAFVFLGTPLVSSFPPLESVCGAAVWACSKLGQTC